MQHLGDLDLHSLKCTIFVETIYRLLKLNIDKYRVICEPPQNTNYHFFKDLQRYLLQKQYNSRVSDGVSLITKSMGLDHKEFIQAFLAALNNDSVVNKLDERLVGNLKFEMAKMNDISDKLSKELDNFRDINTQLQKEVSELRDIVKSKDSKITALEARVENLESKIDQQEQYSRRNSLRVSGIPEETDEVIIPKVINLLNTELKLQIPIEPQEIDRLHRVGKPKQSSPRAVLIKFARYTNRAKVYKNRFQLKRATDKIPSNEAIRDLTSENDNQQKQVLYINEDLTQFRSKLLYQARVLKKDKRIKECWSSDGALLIKDNDGRISTINTMTDLNRIAI